MSSTLLHACDFIVPQPKSQGVYSIPGIYIFACIGWGRTRHIARNFLVRRLRRLHIFNVCLFRGSGQGRVTSLGMVLRAATTLKAKSQQKRLILLEEHWSRYFTGRLKLCG